MLQYRPIPMLSRSSVSMQIFMHKFQNVLTLNWIDDPPTNLVQIQLQARIDKLEEAVKFYEQQYTKYRILWKNECRLAEADRYGSGWGAGVSQTSWSSPSPDRVYCESFNPSLPYGWSE